MNTLIEIASQYRADAEALMDLELPDQVVADTLVGMVGALEAKATNGAAWWKASVSKQASPTCRRMVAANMRG